MQVVMDVACLHTQDDESMQYFELHIKMNLREVRCEQLGWIHLV